MSMYRDYVAEGFEPPTPEEDLEQLARELGRGDGLWGIGTALEEGNNRLSRSILRGDVGVLRTIYIESYQEGFYERKETAKRPFKDFMNAEYMGWPRSTLGYGEWDNYTR